MRYCEIIEATKPGGDPEHDREQRAALWDKLNNARRKRSQAAQTYQDRSRSADDQERAAQQKLAEIDAGQPDPDAERRLWQIYWAKQQRANRALAADAEKRSRGLSGNVSALQSVPGGGRQTGW
jgi:hypothetical protein